VWFRRGRLFIVSPDSRGTACPLSGRNSTYRPVQILEAGSQFFNGLEVVGLALEVQPYRAIPNRAEPLFAVQRAIALHTPLPAFIGPFA